MIVDVTGVKLLPGNGGKDCLGNGAHYDSQGRQIECCCDECDYMLCCMPVYGRKAPQCSACGDPACPRDPPANKYAA